MSDAAEKRTPLYGEHVRLGARIIPVGGWLMLMEGIQVRGTRAGWVRMGEYAVAGGFLVGLSTFQAEFDFGVPQFRFVLEPVMVMAADV